MSQSTEPPPLTAREACRLGDKFRLVENGLWSVTTARQWLTRQTCLQYIERRGFHIERPERRRRA